MAFWTSIVRGVTEEDPSAIRLASSGSDMFFMLRVSIYCARCRRLHVVVARSVVLSDVATCTVASE